MQVGHFSKQLGADVAKEIRISFAIKEIFLQVTKGSFYKWSSIFASFQKEEGFTHSEGHKVFINCEKENI